VTRPELGELTTGQRVMVRRSSNDSRGREPEGLWIPAVVTKVNRVWIDLETADFEPKQIGHRAWRMRRDTQDEGTEYSGNNASFFTLDQYAWDQDKAWAISVLGENGIRLDSSSPWRERIVELADLITGGKRTS